MENLESKLSRMQKTLEKRKYKKTPLGRRRVFVDTSNYNLCSTEQEIQVAQSELEQLFTWNFGQDWKIYLVLEFSKARGYHKVIYNSHSEFEDLKIAFVMRQAHFAKAKLIIHSYYTKGFDETMTSISLNHFRVYWGGQYWVSSEITHKEEQKKIQVLDGEEKPSLASSKPVIAIEEADVIFN